MKSPAAKKLIQNLLLEADRVIATKDDPKQAPVSYTDWYVREKELWKLGEQIRALINAASVLRKDQELYARFFKIVSDVRGGRGRQSFINLFAYMPCASWAPQLVGMLGEPDIDSNILIALTKMQAHGYSEVIEKCAVSETPWIRTEAKKYLEFDKKKIATIATKHSKGMS